MNNRTNNFSPSGYWQHARSPAGSFAPSVFTSGAIGAISPSWSFPERDLIVPSTLPGFQGRSQSTVRILVLDSNMPIEASPRPRVTSRSQGDSILNRDEQKKAVEKLRKEIYNPVLKRVSLYYRDYTPRNNLGAKNEDGKRCAICLDDFEPRQEVTLTPCNHMFHEDCIVPWVRSHGQCPVCRFVISEHSGESGIQSSTSNNTDLGNDPFSRELFSFIRAMEARGQVQSF